MSLVTALAQQRTEPEACKGHHASRRDFYQSARFLPPVTINELTGNHLGYVSIDQGIELGSLELEPGFSVVPTSFQGDHGGCYGIIYCDKHKVVISIEVLDIKQCSTTKQ